MASVHGSNGQIGSLGGAAPLHARPFNDNTQSGRAVAPVDSGGAAPRSPSAPAGSSKGVQVSEPEFPKPEFSKVGRRSAPRLRLSLPGQLVAVERAHRCILLNLSRTGAQVAILDALREGEGAILRCGVIDHFAIVTRSEFGLNALQFEEPLTDAQVIEIRHHFENFAEREKRALIETARKWVNGESDDDRAI